MSKEKSSKEKLETSENLLTEFSSQDKPKQTDYYCGKCSRDAYVNKNETILCRHCGYRIFYKKRLEVGRYLCR